MVIRNTYAELADLYGLVLGEPFGIYPVDENESEVFSFGLLTVDDGFKFTDDETVTESTSWTEDSETVERLLAGKIFVDGNYKPKDGEAYYFIQNSNGAVRKTIYNEDETLDALNLKNDNYFKYQELAESQKVFVVKRIFDIDLKDPSEDEPETPPENPVTPTE